MQACPGVGHLASFEKLLPDELAQIADSIFPTGCTCDSRRVRPGDLFVAIKGERCDGHDYLADAIGRGCAAVISERLLPDLPVPSIRVSDARDVFGRLCQVLAGNPSGQLKLVGVTGTNGKTTTSCLIAGVLSRAGHKVGVLGTLGYFDGDDADDASWTTPPADHLAEWLARMVRNECSHAVMEVSSHALDQRRVAGVRFDAGCVTNVTHDHLDYHGSLADYRASKARLLRQLPPEGLAVINADDPSSAAYLKEIDGPALTVGIHSSAEVTAIPLEQHLSEQIFLLSAGTETVPVRTQMIGSHHIYNCLIAAAVGLSYDIDLVTIARGLEAAGHVPGRLERIECGQPFGVFVDYAHTPDALRQVLQTLRQATRGRLICVFGCGGDRDRRKRPLMGRVAGQTADHVILTSDNPRTEEPQAIIAEILDGIGHDKNESGRSCRRVPTASSPDVQVVPERPQAICQALALAEPGDCVLIAGKGHENYQIIGRRRIPMDDAEIARQWLYIEQPYAFRTP